MLSTHISEFLNRATTKDFLLAAREFILLAESSSIAKEHFYSKLHATLLELYTAGHKLDTIELRYSSAESEVSREGQFETTLPAMISELGEEAFYWTSTDPTYIEVNGEPGSGWTITDKEASQGWLTDDLTDIYRDIKIELQKIDTLETDEAVEDALWQLKWSFAHHWGQHCIEALRYLHYLHYEGKRTL